MQTRRDVLRLACLAGAAGLAGCTAIADGPGSSGPGDESSGTDDGGSDLSELEVPQGSTHRAEIGTTADASDIPVRPRVSLADPFGSSGSPPVLRVDVDNPTDEPVTVGEYRAVVCQYVSSADGALYLYPHSARSTDGEPDRATPDLETDGDEACWRLADGILTTAEYGTVEIPANGTLTAFVGVYGAHDATACLPTGEHRFETTYTVNPLGGDGGGGDTTTDEKPPRATWGFSLEIEEL